MVSTRHHPRPFPPPEESTSPHLTATTTSRHAPTTPPPTSTTSSSKPTRDSPPPPSSRRATPRKRRSIAPKTETETLENEIKQITTAAAQAAEDISSTLTTSMTTRSKDGTRSPPTSTKSTSTKHSTKAATGIYEHTPPPFLILWLLISLPLVAWDTIYVLARPHTMPGGRIHNYLWKPYALYGTVDYIYGWPAWDAKNGFTSAQGTLNLIESFLYGYYLWVIGTRVAGGDGFVRGIALKSVNIFARVDGADQGKIVIRGGSDVASAVLACFASAVMTLSKTVLYWLNEYYSGFVNIGHNNWGRLVWLWIVPNGAWIVLPVYMCWVLGKEIVEGMVTSEGGRRRQMSEDHD